MSFLTQEKALGAGLALGVMVLLSSCSSAPSSSSHYGVETEASHARGSRPEWIDSPGIFRADHQEKMWFSGVALKKYDLEEGRQDAYLDALNAISIGIGATIHDQFNKARAADTRAPKDLYSAKNEKTIEDASLSRARGLITSANADSYWWRKYWVQESPAAPVRYYYDVYCLVSMSREAYKRTVFQTLKSVEESFRSPEARKIIRFMTDRYPGSPPPR
jgi:hypothetical protein